MGSRSILTFPNRMIFHVDMDAFYASVEQFENPALRGKPVIVGGVDSVRGVVSAASYEARVFGVHSAMPVAQARQRCPHGVFLSGRHAVYGDYSKRLMDYLSEYSPIVEQLSVDEAFLDMTGTEKLFGAAEVSGTKLKADTQNRLGLTASIGVAENKFLAKLASDVNKPNGLKVVYAGEAQTFLDPMSVDRLWGVGKKTVLDLHRVGLYTIAQVRAQPLSILIAHFGENFGNHLHNLSHGHDDRELAMDVDEKSISHERTYEIDTSDPELLVSTLLDLSERVARRARKDGLAGRTITFVWRNPDFTRQSHSRTVPEPTCSSQEIFSVVQALWKETRANRPGNRAREFRLIGVRLSHFTAAPQQLSLFESRKPMVNLDSAMDAVRNKFGEGAIFRARLTNRDSEG